MKTVMLFGLVVLATACGDGEGTVINNYYYANPDASTGGRISSSPDGSTSQPSQIDAALEQDAGENSLCTLDSIKELGPALHTYNIVGSPSGFLATWTTDWTTNTSVQTFDRSGNKNGDQILLTESISGAYPVIGSKRGYLMDVHGGDGNRLLRMDSTGSIIGSALSDSASVIVSMSDGDPQEIYSKTDSYWDYVNTTHGYITTLSYVRSDSSLSYIDKYIQNSLPTNENFSNAGVAQNGDTILQLFDHDVTTSYCDTSSDAASSCTRTTSSDFRYMLYNKLTKEFTQQKLFFGPSQTEYQYFIIDVQTTAEGFAVIWGTNTPGHSLRYVTSIHLDSTSDTTYDISSIVKGSVHLSGSRLILSGYDDVTQQRSFAMADLKGNIRETLQISKGNNYYLGFPNVDTTGDGAYAMGWIEENPDYSTMFKVAFFHCQE